MGIAKSSLPLQPKSAIFFGGGEEEFSMKNVGKICLGGVI